MDGQVLSTDTVTTGLIALTVFVVGVMTLVYGYKNRANQYFFIFNFFTSLWIFSSLGSRIFAQEHIEAFVVMGFVAALLAAYFLFRFALEFPQKTPISRFLEYIFVVSLMILITFIFMGKVVTPEIIDPSKFRINLSDYYYQYLATMGTLILASIVILFKNYRKTEGKTRLQVFYILVGLIISAVVAVVFSLILPPLTQSPTIYLWGIYGVLFFLFFTFYAIVEKQLFNIRIILTEISVIIILVALLTQTILSATLNSMVASGAIFLLVAFGGVQLIRSVKVEIFRREKIEQLAKEKDEALKELEQRNKNLAVLQKLSQVVLDEIELKPMVQRILNELPKQLAHCSQALLVITDNGQARALAISQTESTAKIFQLIGSDLEKYNAPINKEDNNIHRALAERQKIEGDDLAEFISPPLNPSIARTIQRLLGIHHLAALPLYSSDQPLGVLLLAYTTSKDRLTHKDQEMALAVADDMSLAIQRAEAYKKLQEANEHLKELDKMKNEFISVASHELNTPLAAVEGYLSMILVEHMGGNVDPKARDYLQRAYASSRRLAAMISDLLNVSRIEQGRVKMSFSLTDVFDLAKSVVEELQVKANSKNLRLTLETHKTDKLKTWCDSNRIREVIVNLVGNAIKYTDKGKIEVRVVEKGEMIAVSVADTGRGIAEADMGKLFQKFSQVNRAEDEHQGTGLGLYISKNFVELHRGHIWVESEVGKGSVFAFEIPILDKAPEKIEGVILENGFSAPKDGSGERVGS